MSFLASIIGQYVLGTLALTTVAFAILRRRDPRKLLLVLVGFNVLRFGGALGALASVADSEAPAFLVQVAIGDAATAGLALVAFVLLLRRSDRAPGVTLAMNVVGLADILTSEIALQWLVSTGRIPGVGIHGPTIGAAVFTALHALMFVLVARETSVRRDRRAAAADGLP